MMILAAIQALANRFQLGVLAIRMMAADGLLDLNRSNIG
jgi:hypothetical protein